MIYMVCWQPREQGITAPCDSVMRLYSKIYRMAANEQVHCGLEPSHA